MIQNIEPEDQNTEREEQGTAASSELADQEKTKTSGPLTTKGTQEEIEENLGGTTNLSLDQLKKEGDAGH